MTLSPTHWLIQVFTTWRKDVKLCESKRHYKTYEDAYNAYKSASRHIPNLRIYHCPICFGYHLTHQKKKGRPQDGKGAKSR